jgi:hypothetical protein
MYFTVGQKRHQGGDVTRQPELLFTVGLKDLKVVMTNNANTLFIRYKGSMDIFEPLNIKLNK